MKIRELRLVESLKQKGGAGAHAIARAGTRTAALWSGPSPSRAYLASNGAPPPSPACYPGLAKAPFPRRTSRAKRATVRLPGLYRSPLHHLLLYVLQFGMIFSPYRG